MRHIYIDEAGRNKEDPYTIVVGLIVNPDTQWRPAVAALEQCITKMVPPKFQTGFQFHAREVWGAKKYKDDDAWPIAAKVEFLQQVMRIPSKVKIPRVLSIVKRGASPTKQFKGKAMRQIDADHLLAFDQCCVHADAYIHGQWPAESASLQVENIEEMHEFLNAGVADRKLYPMFCVRDDRRSDVLAMKLQHIVDQPSFVERQFTPITQLADACAYGLRRFMDGKPNGPEYVLAVCEKPLPPIPKHGAVGIVMA